MIIHDYQLSTHELLGLISVVGDAREVLEVSRDVRQQSFHDDGGVLGAVEQ